MRIAQAASARGNAREDPFEQTLVGLVVSDALPPILRRVGAQRIYLVECSRVPPVRAEFAPDPVEGRLLSDARGLAVRLDLPFWDAVLSSIARRGVSARPALLASAAFHRRLHGQEVDCDAVDAKWLRAYVEQCPRGRFIGAESRIVLASGVVRHLPMLDFRCEISPSNLSLVGQIVEMIGPRRGVFLDSGNSYHFIGSEPISTVALRKFLTRALLFAPIVDHRWIAHQLIDGFCLLRISRPANGSTGAGPVIVGTCAQ